jgi:hypothetical protein
LTLFPSLFTDGGVPLISLRHSPRDHQEGVRRGGLRAPRDGLLEPRSPSRAQLEARDDERARHGAGLGVLGCEVKVFLDGAEFEEMGEAQEWEEVGEDGETLVVKKETGVMDPMAVMRRAIGHVSFAGLKVYD